MSVPACGQQLLEGAVEVLHGLQEGQFAAFDAVQLAFQAGGVGGLHQLPEPLHQQVGDHAAQLRGLEPALVLLHVVPVLDGGDDAGVGGRAADAVLFQLLHQGGFGEARRGLGELLVGVQVLQVEAPGPPSGAAGRRSPRPPRRRPVASAISSAFCSSVCGPVDGEPAREPLDLALGLEHRLLLARQGRRTPPRSRRSGPPPSGRPRCAARSGRTAGTGPVPGGSSGFRGCGRCPWAGWPRGRPGRRPCPCRCGAWPAGRPCRNAWRRSPRMASTASGARRGRIGAHVGDEAHRALRRSPRPRRGAGRSAWCG